jgi:hypothetical protein
LFNPTSRGQRFKKMFNPIKNCETLYKQLNFYFATNIDVFAMDDNYVSFGRTTHFVPIQTNDDHFRREVYIAITHRIIHELDTRFDEVNIYGIAFLYGSIEFFKFFCFI